MGCPNRLLGICVYFMAALHSIRGELCNYGRDPCICKTSSFELNLNPLMDSRGGKDFSVEGDVSYTYYVQPCNKKMSNQISACSAKNPNFVSCQVAGSLAYGLGVLNQYDATNSSEGFILTNSYLDDDFYTRKVRLVIRCADQDTTFTYGGNDGPYPPITYKFTLLSRHICAGGGGSSGGGISAGSVMVIIFFVLLVLYLLGGFLFLKFVKKSQGTETIPNYSFWTSFPSLIKDGIMFTFRCCTRGPNFEKI